LDMVLKNVCFSLIAWGAMGGGCGQLFGRCQRFY
jgi:hypothetical protein